MLHNIVRHLPGNCAIVISGETHDSFQNDLKKKGQADMITWKKVGTALLVASLISSVLAPAAMAASKKKVGKIYLTIDSDIRT